MKFKRAFFVIVVLASIFIINNLIHSIYTLWQKQHLVADAKLKVDKAAKENQFLKQKLGVVEKPQFIEEEARNKLFLGKPGEGVIVLSQKDLESTLSAKPKLIDTRPNWRKWWDVFF